METSFSLNGLYFSSNQFYPKMHMGTQKSTQRPTLSVQFAFLNNGTLRGICLFILHRWSAMPGGSLSVIGCEENDKDIFTTGLVPGFFLIVKKGDKVFIFVRKPGRRFH